MLGSSGRGSRSKGDSGRPLWAGPMRVPGRGCRRGPSGAGTEPRCRWDACPTQAGASVVGLKPRARSRGPLPRGRAAAERHRHGSSEGPGGRGRQKPFRPRVGVSAAAEPAGRSRGRGVPTSPAQGAAGGGPSSVLGAGCVVGLRSESQQPAADRSGRRGCKVGAPAGRALQRTPSHQRGLIPGACQPPRAPQGEGGGLNGPGPAGDTLSAGPAGCSGGMGPRARPSAPPACPCTLGPGLPRRPTPPPVRGPGNTRLRAGEVRRMRPEQPSPP